MRRIFLTAALAALLPVLANAQSYRAINKLTVVPLGGSNFEVIEQRGEGARGILCAAAEYAERRLGATGRVYIREGRGPSRTVQGRKGVVFTTNAASLPQGPSQSVIVSTSRVGAGLPIAHAIQFCRDNIGRDGDILERNLCGVFWGRSLLPPLPVAHRLLRWARRQDLLSTRLVGVISR